ncbi:hypothetical protein PR048_021082 [Dryococelus australis]|uniref:Nrap protein domain-containing protein n=1 Tax=Dryococelus australis TaxID=614101 RepID=A0ABQ9GX92_9NEOP|nr:hypothetical protein PR048_021082 [Dryococelus australis]
MKADSDKLLDYGRGYTLPVISKEVLSLLQKGLGQRVTATTFALTEPAMWSCSQSPPLKKPYLVLGLKLNPEFAYSVITKGPEANTVEASLSLL